MLLLPLYLTSWTFTVSVSNFAFTTWITRKDPLAQMQRWNKDPGFVRSLQAKMCLFWWSLVLLWLFLYVTSTGRDLSNSMRCIYTVYYRLPRHSVTIATPWVLNYNVLFTVQCVTAFLEETASTTTAVTQHEKWFNICFRINTLPEHKEVPATRGFQVFDKWYKHFM